MGLISIDSVLIFEKDRSGWKQVWRIADHIDDRTEGAYTEVNARSYGFFGDEVELADEDTLVISANGVYRMGAVFLFEKKGDVWNRTLEISKNDGGVGFLNIAVEEESNREDFGSAVALSGNILAVGMSAYGDYVDSAAEKSHGNRGAVYIFEKKNGSWEQVLKISDDSDDLKVSLDPEDNFGSSVALFGNVLAVGASGEGEASADNFFGGYVKLNRGAVYLFERDRRGKWSQVFKISDMKDAE